MKELLYDLLFFWIGMALSVFGFFIIAPVLVLIGIIFVVSSVVWMWMDLCYAIKTGDWE